MRNCWLVTVVDSVGVETEFINCLAAANAREAPIVLRGSVSEGWRRRWTRMLSTSCSRAFACSLVSPNSAPNSVGPVGLKEVFPSWPICSRSEWIERQCEVALLFSTNFQQFVFSFFSS